MKKEVNDDNFQEAWQNDDYRKIINEVITRFKIYKNRKSIAMESLWRTMSYYDPLRIKHSKFTSYLWMITRQLCIKYIKSTKIVARNVTKNNIYQGQVYRPHGLNEQLDNLIYHKSKGNDYNERAEKFRNEWNEIISNLDQQDREILEDRLINKLNIKKASEKHNLSISDFKKRYNSIVKKCKTVYSK